MKKQSLLIVGAGASGLMAAKELSRDFNIVILEASERTGGRINSIHLQNDTIESGAEFIHGRLPLTCKLLKKAGIDAVPVEGKFYRKENGQFVSQQDMFEGWDGLLRKMKAVKEDIPMHRFLEKFYPGKSNTAFRQMVTSYTEGFDIADPVKVSVKKLYEEWSAEEGENFRIPSGYISLINYLEKKSECVVVTSKKVKQVNWKENDVTAITSTGEEFHAEKILITVPLGLLQQPGSGAFINFEPAIEEYRNAAANIGYGAVIKIVIKFREAFWQSDAGFFFSAEEYFPTWWTQLPSGIPILTGWCGGPKATMLSRETNDAILSKALGSLAVLFNKQAEQLQQDIIYAEVYNWQQDEFALGAYSYDTVYSAIAKNILNTPILNTVFFAGEALYSGKYPGTVEAALKSGKLAAKQIRRF